MTLAPGVCMPAILSRSITRSSRNIAYYITPHGFGHAVRSLEIINRLMEQAPDVGVVVVSDLPRSLIEQNLVRSVAMRRRRLDIGLVQKDSVRFDLDATVNALQDLRARAGELIAEEVRFLEKEEIGVAVCDIPCLPFYAARRAGIPSVGVGNFTWDWIYETYATDDRRWHDIAAWIRNGYGQGTVYLQLPMHGDASAAFSRVEDVPLVARRSRRPAEETRRLLGVGTAERLYLLSFTALDLSSTAFRRLEQMEGVLFAVKEPLQLKLSNIRSMDALDLSYVDVVAAADGVITKPGYGIVSDCLAHGTPIIYTDRGPFREYDILVEAIQKHLSYVFLPLEDLYAGRWEKAMQTLEGLPRRLPRLSLDGATVCARRILQFFEDASGQ